MVRHTSRPEAVDEQRAERRHGLVVSIGAGLGFGFLGMIAFLAITYVTGNWYIVLSWLPAFGAGIGVILGIRQKDSWVGAVLGGVLGLMWMLATYMPAIYLNPAAADPVGDGILILGGMGIGAIMGWNPEEVPEFLQ